MTIDLYGFLVVPYSDKSHLTGKFGNPWELSVPLVDNHRWDRSSSHSTDYDDFFQFFQDS